MKQRIDYSHEVRKHDSRVMRLLYVALGFSFVGAGVAGVILPVLPATPFFLLAAACFARASERFYNWLLNNPTVGPTIREWRRYLSIRYRTKLLAIGLMAGTLAISIIFFVANPYLKVALTLLGILLAIWLWQIPSRDAPERSKR
ncbi:MAG: YbaN family protein [Betaproteobacteria bacterium]|nr:MAG: YbaN family protein [Betaproteobacteria bacterium]